MYCHMFFLRETAFVILRDFIPIEITFNLQLAVFKAKALASKAGKYIFLGGGGEHPLSNLCSASSLTKDRVLLPFWSPQPQPNCVSTQED